MYLWINDKKSFQFWSSSKTRDYLKFYMLLDATFSDHINTTCQFIKSFLDKKMTIFKGNGAFKVEYLKIILW